MSPTPSAQTPMIRTRYMQGFIAELSRLPDADRRAIGERIAPATLDMISAGSLLGWLPLTTNLECTRAVSATLGVERSHAFFRGLLIGTSQSTLLAGLVQSALRLASPDPGFYLPFIGKGYDVIMRNCGRLSIYRNGPNGSVTELRGLPLEAIEDEYWIQSTASFLSALTDIIAYDSVVKVQDVDRNQRLVRFLGKWQARVKSSPKGSDTVATRP
jgi:hypothetical protein